MPETPRTLYDKLWSSHVVRDFGDGLALLYIDRQLLHEVSSPQTFEGLRSSGRAVRRPAAQLTVADHAVPTRNRDRPIADPLAREQVALLAANAKAFGLRHFGLDDPRQGIVHVIGPELGFTLPGMTLVCSDSHTSTHGAFGALAFGIGASESETVLATQTLRQSRAKTMKVQIAGRLAPGVTAKDLILALIGRLGSAGAVGHAIEYTGEAVRLMSMEARMTLCNLSIEGGARCGYVNPDQTTADYLRGREYAPDDADWSAICSDPDAVYDDVVRLRGEDILPTVTWGTSPDQSVPVGGAIPEPADAGAADSLEFMGFEVGQAMVGTRIDVAFIGSCTNGRLSDFQAVADLIAAGDYHVAPHVRALIVPGSRAVRDALVASGLDRVFTSAGFEVRDTGCSLCCGMNPDSLVGREVCASSSNRNFRGRQGSPTGRTLLMSPVMVAAAAIAGEVTDARRLLEAAR